MDPFYKNCESVSIQNSAEYEKRRVLLISNLAVFFFKVLSFCFDRIVCLISTALLRKLFIKVW